MRVSSSSSSANSKRSSTTPGRRRDGSRCVRFRVRNIPTEPDRVYVEQVLEDVAPYYLPWRVELTFWHRAAPGPGEIYVELYYVGEASPTRYRFASESEWRWDSVRVHPFLTLEKIRFLPGPVGEALYLDNVSLRHLRGLALWRDTTFEPVEPGLSRAPSSGSDPFAPAAKGDAALAYAIATKERLIAIEQRLQEMVTLLSLMQPQVQQKPSEQPAELKRVRKRA